MDRVTISSNGRIVIPSVFRKQLSLQARDELLLDIEDGDFRLRSVRAAIVRAQANVRRYVKPGELLSDELIRDRRRDVKRA